MPDVLGRGRRGRLLARATSPSTPRARELHGDRRRGASARCGRRCRATSTSPTRSAPSPRAVALGVEPDEAAAGLAGARAGARALRAGRRGPGLRASSSTTPTRPTRSTTCCARRARLTEGRVIAVFGAGGDRDRDKRPKMGGPAPSGSDLAIVTSDNPRSEDPEAIIAEVLAGAGARSEVEVEPDRRAAIALAFARARAGRHRGDRRQGPRAGPGVRGRPQGPLRRPRGRPRGARARSAVARDEPRPAADRRRARRRDRRRGRAGLAGPGDDRLRRDRRRATSSSACAASASTAASSPRAAIEAGAWGVVVGPASRSH